MELDNSYNSFSNNRSSQPIRSAFGGNNNNNNNNGGGFSSGFNSAFGNNTSTFNNSSSSNGGVNVSAFGNKMNNNNNNSNNNSFNQNNNNNRGFNNNGFNNKNMSISNNNMVNNMNNNKPVSSFTKTYNNQSSTNINSNLNSSQSNLSKFNQSNISQQPNQSKFQHPNQSKFQQPSQQPSQLSSTSTQQRKCRNWQMNGFCERGNTCIFLHDNNITNNTSSFNNIKSSTTPCKFYLQNGMCTNSNCTYSHDDIKTPITNMGSTNMNQFKTPFDKAPNALAQSTGSNKNICKFFLLGKCTKGDACPFEHSTSSNDSNPQSTPISSGGGNFSSSHGGITKSYKPSQNDVAQSVQSSFNSGGNFSASHGGITKTYNNKTANSSKFNGNANPPPLAYNSNFSQAQVALPDYSDDVEMGDAVHADNSGFTEEFSDNSYEQSLPTPISKFPKSTMKQPVKQQNVRFSEPALKFVDKQNSHQESKNEIVLKVEGYPTNTRPSDLQDHFKYFGNMIRCVKKPTNAFVTYSSQSSAQRAIQDGSIFKNSKLNIRYHTPKLEPESSTPTFKVPNFIVNKPPSKLGFATPVLERDDLNIKKNNFNSKPSLQLASKPVSTPKPLPSFTINKPVIPSSKTAKPPSFIISKPLATTKQPARLLSKNAALKPTSAPKLTNITPKHEEQDNLDLLGDAYDDNGENNEDDNYSGQDEEDEEDNTGNSDEEEDEDFEGESDGFAKKVVEKTEPLKLNQNQTLANLRQKALETRAARFDVVQPAVVPIKTAPIKSISNNESRIETSEEIEGEFVGECLTMCSEEERLDREIHRELSEFEIVPNSNPPVSSPDLCIAKYKRSAAGGPRPPVEKIRPLHILQNTMSHLKEYVLDADPENGFIAIYKFVRDRLRAIRQDITYQHALFTNTSIEIHQEQFRFFLWSGVELCEINDDAEFNPKQHDEAMAQVMTTILQAYVEARRINRELNNEAEFQCYQILMNIMDPDVLSHLPRDLIDSSEISYAFAVSSAVRTGNYIAFFNLFEEGTILQKCCVFRFFPLVRSNALKVISKVYKTLNVEELADMLYFDDYDVVNDFCASYGIYPEDSTISFDSPLSIPSRPPVYSCSAIFDAASSFSKKDIIEGYAIENYEDDQGNEDGLQNEPEGEDDNEIIGSVNTSPEPIVHAISRSNSALPIIFPPIPNPTASGNVTPKNTNTFVSGSFSFNKIITPVFQHESTPRRESVPTNINSFRNSFTINSSNEPPSNINSFRNSFTINTNEPLTPKKASFITTSNFINQPSPSPVFRKELTPNISRFEPEIPHYNNYELNNASNMNDYHDTYHKVNQITPYINVIEEPVITPEEYIRTVTQYNTISSATSAITSVKTRLKRLGAFNHHKRPLNFPLSCPSVLQIPLNLSSLFALSTAKDIYFSSLLSLPNSYINLMESYLDDYMGFLTQMGTPVADELDSAASWLVLKLSRGVSNNSKIYPKVASYNQQLTGESNTNLNINISFSTNQNILGLTSCLFLSSTLVTLKHLAEINESNFTSNLFTVEDAIRLNNLKNTLHPNTQCTFIIYYHLSASAQANISCLPSNDAINIITQLSDSLLSELNNLIDSLKDSTWTDNFRIYSFPLHVPITTFTHDSIDSNSSNRSEICLLESFRKIVMYMPDPETIYPTVLSTILVKPQFIPTCLDFLKANYQIQDSEIIKPIDWISHFNMCISRIAEQLSTSWPDISWPPTLFHNDPALPPTWWNYQDTLTCHSYLLSSILLPETGWDFEQFLTQPLLLLDYLEDIQPISVTWPPTEMTLSLENIKKEFHLFLDRFVSITEQQLILLLEKLISCRLNELQEVELKSKNYNDSEDPCWAIYSVLDPDTLISHEHIHVINQSKPKRLREDSPIEEIKKQKGNELSDKSYFQNLDIKLEEEKHHIEEMERNMKIMEDFLKSYKQ